MQLIDGSLSKFDLWDLNFTNWNAKGVTVVLKLGIDIFLNN